MLALLKVIWTFAKLIPWQVYAAAIGILAALWLAHAWADSIRTAQQAKDNVALTAAQNQISLIEAANASSDAAIKALQQKLVECERGRVADLDAQQKAQAAYKASLDVLKAGEVKARAKTAALLAGECKDRAQLPSCVTGAP